MTYIAIKNTEHKGVYEEKGFNRTIFGTKGMSYRKFKDNELQKALDWAEVKALKTSSEKKSDKKNINTKERNVSIHGNGALEMIMDYKNRGFEGVCITTKSLGEIILKINQVDIFRCTHLERFDRQTDSLVEHLEVAFENAKIEKEKYPYITPYPYNVKFEIVEFDKLSNVVSLNSDFLNLDNFWVRGKQSNIFESKKLKLSRIAKIEGNICDYWIPYNNFTLSNDEIISIQPLEFTMPSNTSYFGEHVRGSYAYISKKIKKNERKAIEKVFNNTEVKGVVITQIK